MWYFLQYPFGERWYRSTLCENCFKKDDIVLAIVRAAVRQSRNADDPERSVDYTTWHSSEEAIGYMECYGGCGHWEEGDYPEPDEDDLEELGFDEPLPDNVFRVENEYDDELFLRQRPDRPRYFAGVQADREPRNRQANPAPEAEAGFAQVLWDVLRVGNN